MADNPEYWFPAKRYGWGWGPPRTWQGWGVLVMFVALVGLGLFVFPPAEHYVDLLIYVGVVVGLLLIVCFAKGEPPRWRWGKE